MWRSSYNKNIIYFFFHFLGENKNKKLLIQLQVSHEALSLLISIGFKGYDVEETLRKRNRDVELIIDIQRKIWKWRRKKKGKILKKKKQKFCGWSWSLPFIFVTHEILFVLIFFFNCPFLLNFIFVKSR